MTGFSDVWKYEPLILVQETHTRLFQRKLSINLIVPIIPKHFTQSISLFLSLSTLLLLLYYRTSTLYILNWYISSLFLLNGAAGVLTKDILSQIRSKFYADPRNLQAQNVCARVDPLDACISRRTVETTNHVFQHKIETEGKPITNQKNTGRCWLFATLNVIRVPFIKQHNLEEFEFSQSYLFFWDKVCIYTRVEKIISIIISWQWCYHSGLNSEKLMEILKTIVVRQLKNRTIQSNHRGNAVRVFIPSAKMQVCIYIYIINIIVVYELGKCSTRFKYFVLLCYGNAAMIKFLHYSYFNYRFDKYIS